MLVEKENQKFFGKILFLVNSINKIIFLGNHYGIFRSAGFGDIRHYRYWSDEGLCLDVAGAVTLNISFFDLCCICCKLDFKTKICCKDADKNLLLYLLTISNLTFFSVSCTLHNKVETF